MLARTALLDLSVREVRSQTSGNNYAPTSLIVELLGHYLLYSVAELVVCVFVGLKTENKF